ncbi:MAG: sulfotransferase domain-containing protein [Phycisphaerales bacterium]|nr:sulfotransferase domain-containing protein [Phycisphaerales bacterium]
MGALIWLASYPKSGNTWMRSLLEAATGEQLGSKYNDKVMRREREGIAIKTHGSDSFAYTDAIHIVRNPFDAIWSFYKWSNEFRGQHVEWERFCPSAATQWDRHTRHWLSVGVPTVFLSFEDLRAEPVRELSRVIEFLGRDVSDERLAEAVEACGIDKLRKANADAAGKFFRGGSIGKGLEHFDAPARELVLRVTGETMRRVGYGELADHARSAETG